MSPSGDTTCFQQSCVAGREELSLPLPLLHPQGRTNWVHQVFHCVRQLFLGWDTVLNTHNIKEQKFNVAYILRDSADGQLGPRPLMERHGGESYSFHALGTRAVDQCHRGKDTGPDIDSKATSPWVTQIHPKVSSAVPRAASRSIRLTYWRLAVTSPSLSSCPLCRTG